MLLIYILLEIVFSEIKKSVFSFLRILSCSIILKVFALEESLFTLMTILLTATIR